MLKWLYNSLFQPFEYKHFTAKNIQIQLLATRPHSQRWSPLTDDWPAAWLQGRGTRCGDGRCRMGLGNQAERGLLVVVVVVVLVEEVGVVVVHYAQIHGKDG